MLIFRLKIQEDYQETHFNEMACQGGDNSLGLLVKNPNREANRQLSINSTIAGRPSHGFIAKVTKSN